MNIKCSFCQMPYTLSRVQMLDALQEMNAHKLTHYDAHCPRCRRATPVQRTRMEIFFPNWRDALKQFEAEMKANPQPEAPLPARKPGAESTPAADSKVGAEPVGEKSAPKAKPAEKSKALAKKSSPKAKKK
jgi:hypothetical protein